MISAIIEFLRTLTDPEKLIALLTNTLTGWTGYLVLFVIVFAETGLLVGFFFPGDSLLFTVGVVVGAGQLNFLALGCLLSAAAVLGEATGYYLTRRAAPVRFNPPC